MPTTIKIKRGLKANLPTLSVGELAYCTDTNELFIGTDTGNELVNQDIDTDEYIVSGTFDDTTGDLTLTRSDAGEITINLDGRYLQSFTDTNDYVTSADFTNGTLTLTRTDAGEVTVDLDGRYLQSFTETDPTVPAHVKGITTTNISNWDTAYTWGDHAQEGYLTSFTETDPVFTAQKGQPNGVATLDATGLVPGSQLPSYVDDVLEYADTSGFPTTGESGKIYVTLDTNKTYRWSGSSYVEISASLVPNDGTLTVEGSNGVTGSGTFTADQSSNSTITLSHSDTSNQANVDNSSNANFIKSMDFDTYGHVTSVTSGDVSTEYVSGVIETNASINKQFWTGTQAEYDAIATKDPDTIYLIEE